MVRKPLRPARVTTLAISAHALGWPAISVGYLIGYVVLDWASFIYPYSSFGITPWNPSTGLSFALVLLLGRRYIPLLLLGPLLAEFLVRGWPLAAWLEFSAASAIAGSYAAGLYVLTARETRFNAGLATLRDVVILIGCAFVTAATASLGYVGLLTSSRMLPMVEFWPAALRFWIGDVIGIIVLTPFLLVLATGRLSGLASRADAFLALAIFGVVGLVFSLPASAHLQLFYLLFLPIILIALRYGLERVTLGLVLTQVAMIIGVQLTEEKAGAVTAFQLLLFVLAVAGLLMGAIVSQQQRFESQLRQQQDALAKVARIGSMGALGAAIAHEINQPLSAIATYADIVQRELEKDTGDKAIAGEAARKTIAQVDRIAEIVRRLRDLIQLGRSEIGPYAVQHIVGESLDLLRDDLARNNTKYTVNLDSRLTSVSADRVQIEQVLVNLVRNGLEALSDIPEEDRAIVITVSGPDDSMIEFSIADTGPGFAFDWLKDDILPLSSTKPDGMGLGLMLCKTIVEAHGGRLWVDKEGPGGIVRFTLRAVT